MVRMPRLRDAFRCFDCLTCEGGAGSSPKAAQRRRSGLVRMRQGGTMFKLSRGIARQVSDFTCGMEAVLRDRH